MIVVVVIIFFLIGMTDFPPLVKHKKRREIIALSVFFLLAFGTAVLLCFQVNIPSPVKAMEYLIHNVLNFTYP